MVEIGSSLVRARVRRYLSSHAIWMRPVKSVLRDLDSCNCCAYIFGGFVRDIVLGRPGTRPRDIDIVVALADIDLIQSVLRDRVVGRTSFGGIRAIAGSWPIDIWPATETWALKAFPERFAGVGTLPMTTFFNAESILVSIAPGMHGERDILEGGFFDAANRRVLEINFEENPDRALCVARSFYLALKLDFAIGPRLLDFLRSARYSLDVADVMDAQVRHFGRPRMDEDALERVWSHVLDVGYSCGAPVRLPSLYGNQLMLWDFEDHQLTFADHRSDWHC